MKGPKDPVDHARTTRPHAGESMKDNKILPALIAIGAEKLQDMMLASGIKPEDRLLSRGIIEARED